MVEVENIVHQDNNTQELINRWKKYVEQNPWIYPLLDSYRRTKKSSEWLEQSLQFVEQTLEQTAKLAVDTATPLYNNYVLASKNEVARRYNSGVERTKHAIETGKDYAVKGATMGLGAAVVATQLSLALSAEGACLALDGVGATKRVGVSALTSAKEFQRGVERKIWKAVDDTRKIASIPVEKATEVTNAMLDILETILEKTLGVTIDDKPDSPLHTRVSTIASTVADTLTKKAHNEVVDPLHAQLAATLEHLSRSFVLMDIVREKQRWALEKMDELSVSVSDLKSRIEQESLAYRQTPEEVLLRGVQSSSRKLGEKLQQLKEKKDEVLGELPHIQQALDYVERLEKNLGEANDLYAVRDEVLSEARQRLSDLSSWSSNLTKKTPAN